MLTSFSMSNITLLSLDMIYPIPEIYQTRATAYKEQTAVLYFQARNGTFKRVPQKGNVGFEQSNGGMTVYYTPVISGQGQVTAFKPVSTASC